MNLIDRLRLSLARPLLRKMAASQLLPVISPWKTATFLDADFPTLDAEAYKGNSAVFACASALAFAFIEPSIKVYNSNGEELPDHPTRRLIIKPNDIMGEGELMLHTMTYAAVGGNGFWHKKRNNQDKVINLVPYHIGNLLPVPNYENVPDENGEVSWILGYEFDDGTGRKTRIPKRDIVHFKWPSVDMYQPWMAMPPLLPALREVATDSEAIRFLKAVLQNDAVPRMVMYVPPESNLDLDDPEKIARYKAQFREKYGGDNRGNLAILTGGAKVERISLNMEELNFNGIHRIPESRICADMRVPAIVAGLNVGLENSTYSNYREAREGLTQDTLAPIWKLTGSEINADSDLNPNGDTIRFDLSEVQALQEDTNSKWARLTAALAAGGLMINDFRRGVGLAEVQRGNVFLLNSDTIPVNLDEAGPEKAGTTKEVMGYHIEQGVVSRNEARASLGLPAEDASQDEKLRTLQALLTVVKLAVEATIPLESAIQLVGLQGISIEPAVPAQLPAPADEPPIVENGNTRGLPGAGGLKLSGQPESSTAHVGEFVSLMCPVCYQTGATVYADHKGLAVCTHCGITFDPSIELVEL